MWILFLLLFSINAMANQVTMSNGDVVDIQGNVSYLVAPGSATRQFQAQMAQWQINEEQLEIAQKQLNDLRKTTLNSVADAQIASNPVLKSQQDNLKQVGAV